MNKYNARDNEIEVFQPREWQEFDLYNWCTDRGFVAPSWNTHRFNLWYPLGISDTPWERVVRSDFVKVMD